jgi:hypothetical protein
MLVSCISIDFESLTEKNVKRLDVSCMNVEILITLSGL